MRVAVVGSGIAGLSCAWLLSAKHEVVLFEREGRLGGHTNTVLVPTAQGPQPVDTGFIVYNERNYPLLTAMFRGLGVATQDSDMSFGVSLADGAYEYAGDNLATLFLQARNLVSPRHWRMLLEILRFNALTKRLLSREALPAGSLGEFLDAHGFCTELGTRYLLPMAGAIWSCSTRQARSFPYAAFARFFDAHGLLNTVSRPQWRSVVGGSQRYVERLRLAFRGALRLDAPVENIRRCEDAAWVTTRGGGEERFDAVVCAAHGDETARMLVDADEAEARVLGAIRYAPNRAFLHTDASLMPRRRRAWSSWNYLGRGDAESDDPIAVTYWMNRLQCIAGDTNYFVSLNPPTPPAPDKVLHETIYEHPQFCTGVTAAQAALPAIQGRHRTWFCGAWTGYGFHEDGLKSALRVAAVFGCTPSWLPAEGGELQATPSVLEPETVQV
jgi:predicted NAD/FAD-binding protein